MKKIKLSVNHLPTGKTFEGEWSKVNEHDKYLKTQTDNTSKYERCPICYSSFSFRKPIDGAICPFCDSNISSEGDENDS